MMTRYFIHLAFDGTFFHGWQRQPNGVTVQQTIEKAMTTILRTEIAVTGAGRTDAGVHASFYVAHFDFAEWLTADALERLSFKLNSYLPKSIAILKILPVRNGVHARFTALLRTYRYYIARRPDPFTHSWSHFIHGHLDVASMNFAASLIGNYSDFTSFSKVDNDSATNVCRVTHATWEERDHQLVFTISADRFLRNMVRAIVGTLLDTGKGKIEPSEIGRIIEARDRRRAGESVPAKGLFLEQIVYPPDIFHDGATGDPNVSVEY